MILFSEEWMNYIQLATNFATVCAAMAAFLTMWVSKKTTAGEFILNLQQEFSAGYGIEVYTACWNDYENRKQKGNKMMVSVPRENIVNYLTFFESLYIMHEKGILSLSELDDLFGRRFFVVVNNLEVQKELGGENYEYYLNIYKLHSIWQMRRILKGEELFNDKKGIVRELSDVLKEEHDQLKNVLELSKSKLSRSERKVYNKKMRSIIKIQHRYKINRLLRRFFK